MTMTLLSGRMSLWRIRNGGERRLSVALLFEPRDLWIGVYWTRTMFGEVEVYVCLVPVLVVRVRIEKFPNAMDLYVSSWAQEMLQTKRIFEQVEKRRRDERDCLEPPA